VKKIFRKNQLVITALALMIAVAGYFSYMNNNIGEKETTAASADVEYLAEDYDISDEDSLIEGEIFTDEGDELAAEADDGEENEEDLLASLSEDTTDSVIDDTADIDNPGETVFTSTTVSNLDYAAEMKLNREQIRSKNKEALLEIVNNTSISDSLKQDAVSKMIALTDIAEREAAAEMLLEAKGFTDVVVSITEDSCDVVLNMGEVTDAKRAQVEDIVKRKTNVSADEIIITPIVVTDVDAQ
jgi:stage III sporulation protein AH